LVVTIRPIQSLLLLLNLPCYCCLWLLYYNNIFTIDRAYFLTTHSYTTQQAAYNIAYNIFMSSVVCMQPATKLCRLLWLVLSVSACAFINYCKCTYICLGDGHQRTQPHFLRTSFSIRNSFYVTRTSVYRLKNCTHAHFFRNCTFRVGIYTLENSRTFDYRRLLWVMNAEHV